MSSAVVQTRYLFRHDVRTMADVQMMRKSEALKVMTMNNEYFDSLINRMLTGMGKKWLADANMC